MLDSKQHEFSVIHCMPVWIPDTATYLYSQISNLPKSVDNHIVCERLNSLQEFPIDNIHSADSTLDKTRFYLNHLLRKSGIRIPYGKLSNIIDSCQKPVVHSHWGDVGWQNAKLVSDKHVPHVVTFYGKDVNFYPQQKRWRTNYLDLFGKLDLVLCEGPHMAHCIEKLGCPSSKIQVKELGVDLDKIPYIPREWPQNDVLRILISASFRQKKGIPYALLAISEFQKMGNKVEVTIIGDSSNDPRSIPEKTKILDTLNNTGLMSVTKMLGYQPYKILMDEAYKHHIFMSPSVTADDGDTEGGAPVTITEMAATGMVIVSTTHCDIPHVVEDKKTGLLAKEKDVPGLVERLCWLSEHRDNWPDMLAKSRQHIENKFNKNVLSKKLFEIYAGLANR